ncbi:uncharacterized protein LOC105704104 [Orussus abietinus]|uniref:uncharacterized protein LOC105704104 n=1 Tax=Orussus abietinus TaxID=222816 RepID=UPI000625E9B4|nr:uncharacterized protein LOC105704104 [Orussus abietinus]
MPGHISTLTTKSNPTAVGGYQEVGIVFESQHFVQHPRSRIHRTGLQRRRANAWDLMTTFPRSPAFTPALCINIITIGFLSPCAINSLVEESARPGRREKDHRECY